MEKETPSKEMEKKSLGIAASDGVKNLNLVAQSRKRKKMPQWSMLGKVKNSLDLDMHVKDVMLPCKYLNPTDQALHKGPVLYDKSSIVMAYKAEFNALQSQDEQDAWLQHMKELDKKGWQWGGIKTLCSYG
ncbi:hypothetical protein BT96DRAFT_949313 [Gymnopus androsaceus JB14]|uniref:Uncharacterized protein n=1 Tax=Gymnopus androsaceus JB14 TaxID=1447944 RepID=A0A6A4GLR7_9AGAR|nr:hypothetical protein BT96DRAFT_949313 [Gymnopus androsaceus JB14]